MAVLLVVVLLVLFFARSSAVPVSPTGGTGGTSGGTVTSVSGSSGETAPSAARGSATCRSPDNGVVYVLDRGDASKMLFDPLKNAAYKSVETLGPDNEFAIIFWKRSTDSGLEDVSFPIKGTVARRRRGSSTPARQKFEDLTASGATEIDDAINAAMARKPDEIVIATPKGYLLEENVLAAVDRARGTSPSRSTPSAWAPAAAAAVAENHRPKDRRHLPGIPEKDLRAQ